MGLWEVVGRRGQVGRRGALVLHVGIDEGEVAVPEVASHLKEQSVYGLRRSGGGGYLAAGEATDRDDHFDR
jgi:hypothetical protein